ncbi:hypothetical protein GPX89_34970 [Nocardia sp. ET3-3]|uniref:Uncharacterized protein n=1 Tax=Nocardia terrae TaxID=2675851 RepID=A0A7K1V7H2_9NOCA|nr:hypothetical protein [Nocardia terrae]MVU82421.1 hypothetical protein [Nocardia terrae]
MSSRDINTPARPRRGRIAAAGRKSLFPAAWILGGLGVVAAGLLFVAVLFIHAGQNTTGGNWQPAALLGLIALAFGAPILIAGLLVRFGVATKGDD